MQLSEIRKQVCAVSIQVGKMILTERKQHDTPNFEIKGKNDFVTYVDKMAEKAIIEQLRTILPEAGVIAEESGTDAKDVYNWIIDPLDGTTNFIHNIPVFCVSIALQRNNEIIIGVVYEINNEECFSAHIDGGATLNNKTIRVSETIKLANSLVATGFPYTDFDFIKPYMATFNEVVQKSRGIRRLGSAAADLSYMACGRFDCFFEFGLNAWDVAGGSLIVTESGGRVMDYKMKEDFIFGGEIIAINGISTNELPEIIAYFY